SLVEAILENPDAILRKQLDRVKGDAIAEMKAEGLSYEQRMEELEKLEYPKPNRDFIYSTFNAFSDAHPWVGQENIRPKSIAREMFEQYRSFSDYIKEYELHRTEGLLLRHLSGVHKVLTQTVPDTAKTEAVREMEVYLGTMLRQVDSSLLDEWERMRDPNYLAHPDAPEVRPPGAEEAARDITRDAKAFTAEVRNRIFIFLRALANQAYDQALEVLDTRENAAVAPWTIDRLRTAAEAYRDARGRIRLDPPARNPQLTFVRISEDKQTWNVQQMLVDPEEENDWVAEFTVDLAASRDAGAPVLRLVRIGLLE
ncbi:MAG: DUF3516 domain-containing protein, partial [Chthoniobacteraceae bacterium]